MNTKRITLLFAAAWLALALPAMAQQWAGRGRLQGDVTDKDGKPIEGATVTFRWGKDPTLGPAPLKTDKHGKWSILGLVGGAWSIIIEADGYKGSEGQANVNEFGPAPAIHVRLNQPTKEEIAAAQPHNEASEAWKAGNDFFTQQKWAEAREKYEKVLPDAKDVETQILVLKRIGDTYRMERNATGALETYKKIEVLAPDDTELKKLIAYTTYAEGKKDEAIVALKAYVELAPTDTEGMQNLVNWLVDAGKEAEAKTYIARLPQGAKVDPDALLNIGVRQFNENKITEAIQSFDRVVQENPDLADAYYYRGRALMAGGKYKEAKADFEKLLALEPKGARADEVKAMLKDLG